MECTGDKGKRHCRACYNAYMAEYMTKRYHRRRDEFIESRGGCCEACGSTEQLEIDHIRREEKSFSIGRALSGWSESRVKEELAKCQVLCHDCHAKKTVAELSVPHGGGQSGKRGCYCDECRPAKEKYMRKYYANLPRRFCKCGVEIDRRGRTQRCRSCK